MTAIRHALGFAGAAATLGLLAPLAAGDEFLPPTRAEQPLILGAGVIYEDKPYRAFDDDEKWQPFPLVIWENERFFWRFSTGGWKLFADGTWEVAAILEGREDGYDSDDADILEGMGDRDPAIEAGAHVSWQASNGFGLKGTWVTDISDNHNGYELRAELFYVGLRENWMFRPSATLAYQSDDLVDYYFGVAPEEATLLRPAYEADDDLAFRVETVASWAPGGGSWQFLLGGRAEFLGEEVDDSPIVSRATVLSAFLAAGYRF